MKPERVILYVRADPDTGRYTALDMGYRDGQGSLVVARGSWERLRLDAPSRAAIFRGKKLGETVDVIWEWDSEELRQRAESDPPDPNPWEGWLAAE